MYANRIDTAGGEKTKSEQWIFETYAAGSFAMKKGVTCQIFTRLVGVTIDIDRKTWSRIHRG